jgi:hypothetical protein
MLPVSLDYLLFIADFALSKVYLKHKEHEDCIGSDVKDVIRSGQNVKNPNKQLPAFLSHIERDKLFNEL